VDRQKFIGRQRCSPPIWARAHMNVISRLPGGRLSTFCFLFSAAVFLAVTLVQKNPPVRPASSPVLIWDIDLTLAKGLPRNFRTTDDPLKASDGKTPSTTGLVDLHASGSGEFTADNLKLLLTRMHGPVTIFDLRQETHIFVNGLPVSWFATRDWANVGPARLKSNWTRQRQCNRSRPVAKLRFGLVSRSKRATLTLPCRNRWL
jgi:hypothetical protein